MAKTGNLIGGITLILLVSAFTIFTSLPEKGASHLGKHEKRIIEKSGEVMYVLDVSNKADSAILRTACKDFSYRDLRSAYYKKLASAMLATVQSPQHDGVGLAAPQVGISHRMIVVYREDLDTPGYKVYPNIRIDSLYGKSITGPEGCLSVPPYRGLVKRHENVRISYIDIDKMERVSEDVSGYSAIIFQHECDHLDGILYSDKSDSLVINQEWKNERARWEEEGLYKRPDWF